MKIILINNRAFQWYQDGEIWAKGYLYDTKNRLFQGEGIPKYFYGIVNEEDFRRKVREANGSFLVILKIGNVYYVAVDRVRSMLLFIAQKDGSVYISDDAPALRDHLGLENTDLDKLKVEEVRQSGYTVGSCTMYKAIVQLRGGEYAVVNDGGYRIQYYFEHTHGNYLDVSREEAFRMLDGVTERVFRRLIDSINGRKIAIPLSSGYDSRYIVAALKKIGYDNACCFTYGRTDSFEVRTSRQVAEQLGYEWHFVEYTPETWEAIFTKEWLPYYVYSGQLSQLPHCQDIFAVKYLLDHGVIKQDTIIVPGYGGGVLGGAFVASPNDVVDCSFLGIAQYLYEKHFNYQKESLWKEKIIADIQKHFSLNEIVSINDFNNQLEQWVTTHRSSKFILNALRGYDYFDLEWRIPLWDNELMEFWYRVPYEHRGQPTWYADYLLEGIFKEEGIAYRKGDFNSANLNPWLFSFMCSVKRGMSHIIPRFLLDSIRNCIFPQLDFNQSNSIYELLSGQVCAADLENIRDIKNVNAILSLRYLQVVEGIH